MARDEGEDAPSGSAAGVAGAFAWAGRRLLAIRSAARPESPASLMAPGLPLQRISGWICGRAAPQEGWSSLLGGFEAQLDVARASTA